MRGSKFHYYVLLLILLSVTNCQKSLDSPVNNATLPHITDLEVDSLTGGIAYLSWTAPNYDPAHGGLYRYDLRYSSESIEVLDWEPADVAEPVSVILRHCLQTRMRLRILTP